MKENTQFLKMVCRYLNSDTEAPLDYQVIARGGKKSGLVGFFHLYKMDAEAH